jgi:hypothetical protein
MSKPFVTLLAAALAAGCTGREAPSPPSQAPEAVAAPEPAAAGASAAPGDAPAPTQGAGSAAPGTTASALASASPADRPPAPGSAPPPPPGARIYARSRFAWIAPAPGASTAWLGYMTSGGSVALDGTKEEARVGGGEGCSAWYRVQPRGFVCEGRDATTDADDPAVAALAHDGGDLSSPWPFHYGESLGAPRYPSMPTAAMQRRREAALDAWLEKAEQARTAEGDTAVAAIDKSLIGVDLTPAGIPAPQLFEVGPRVRESRTGIAPTSTLAWTRTFDGEGRSWVLTADHAVMPRDKVRPYPRSRFSGVHLDDATRLPLAFFRKTDRPKYRRAPDGTFTLAGESWGVRTFTALTGESAEHDGERYWQTREPDIWARDDDASVVRPAEKAPRLPVESARNTWVEISVQKGWLIAYEGERPVFTTLISPGRGGVPVPGKEPIETASTPTGTFRVDGKFRWATMVSSSNDNIVHSEVMYVQNFSGPHALHGAYWHDAWGEPKSGGCVNLSPIDSKWLFEWSEPKVPDGWQGLRSGPEAGPATVVVIHR